MNHPKKIYYSSHFIRAVKKLNPDLQAEAIEKESLFVVDCFNPILKTHKLTGKLKAKWSFSVNYSYRILFKFLSGDQALSIDIGDHDIYK